MKRILATMLAAAFLLSLAACGAKPSDGEASAVSAAASVEAEDLPTAADAEQAESPDEAETSEFAAEDAPSSSEEVQSAEEPQLYVPSEEEQSQRTAIESTLDLRNMDVQWSYDATCDAWILAPVVDVVNPELPDQQGVSVAVPGAYITGIDTDGDGSADLEASEWTEAVSGNLILNDSGFVTSENGQTYTSATAPVIFTTGAAGYGSQYNQSASGMYCQNGYLSVSCGNRGKQDAVYDSDGNLDHYTGDAPSCLCDQKAAVRFVKYNMLLGNLPGSVDYWVTTGGSGGAAHAAMYAATSNHPDFYDYQIEAGAVGVYQNSDGSYSTAVTIDGQPVEISDGVWGTVAYSAITSLYEGDMAQAFEYHLDPDYAYNTEFQAQLAEYLSSRYMEYINEQDLHAEEAAVGFDLNGDGDLEDSIALSIEYDPEKYPDTNGYGGSYLDLYLMEFRDNLSRYLANLDYAEGWTWFDANGTALSDDAVAAMTLEDKAQAFLEGRYNKGSNGFGGPPGGGPMGPPPDMMGPPPDMAGNLFGGDIRDGGPGAGTTQASGSGSDSRSYATFEELVDAYRTDISEIENGDRFGKNIVDLYNPMNYIGDPETDAPAWTRIVMGGVEGDMPMMASLNMQLGWLASGTQAMIEWQWDGGHVPNEILGDSLSLTVDAMFGQFAGGNPTKKAPAQPITENGDGESPSGKDLTGWVSISWEDQATAPQVEFTLGDVMAYRNAGAMKAVPGFDTIDYGQEDYVFGKADQDARHWDRNLLDIFENEEYAQVLAPLFNQS